MLYAIVGVLVIILDQWVKFWTAGHIPMTSAGEEFIPGILSLANVHNEGAAFGFLSGDGARIPFIVLAGVFALVVIIALATGLISGKLARWSIVLVTAGGLSNCLDRVIYGYVQDMFKLEFINFPVFNVADIFITVFAIIFALAVIFGKTRRDDDEDEEFEDEEEEEEPRISRRKQKRLSRRAAKEAEEEDEDEEEEPVPVKKPKKEKKPTRRQRRGEAEKEDEVPAAAVEAPKKESPRPAAAETPKRRPETDSAAKEDPFAAWERANAKVEARKPVPVRQQPAPRPAAPAQQRGSAASAPAARRTEKAPAAAPAKPAAKPVVEEEFSLDDILNEFR